MQNITLTILSLLILSQATIAKADLLPSAEECKFTYRQGIKELKTALDQFTDYKSSTAQFINSVALTRLTVKTTRAICHLNEPESNQECVNAYFQHYNFINSRIHALDIMKSGQSSIENRSAISKIKMAATLKLVDLKCGF